jgi:cyclase
MPDGSLLCHSHSGSQAEGRDPASWAAELEKLGVGEILITSIERDGTMQGYDLDLVRQVAAAVKIPVIASGGAGSYDHMLQAVHEGGASAVAAASIFHFTQQTPLEAKKHLAAHCVPVRWYG